MPKKPISERQLSQLLTQKTRIGALDFETTGLGLHISSGGKKLKDVILQMGMVTPSGQKISMMIDPRGQGQEMTNEFLEYYGKGKAYQTHGISTPFGGYGGKLYSVEEAVGELNRQFGPSYGGFIAGWNPKFDLRMARENLGWSPSPEQFSRVISVDELARQSFPGRGEGQYTLEKISNMLGIKGSTGALHDAVYDAEVTRMILMDKRMSKAGLSKILRSVHKVYSPQDLRQMQENEKLMRPYKKYAGKGGLSFGQGKPVGQKAVDFNYIQGSGGLRIDDPTVIRFVKDPITGKATKVLSPYLGHMSGVHQANLQRAGAEAEEARRVSYAKQENIDYRVTRDVEDALFEGEHSRGVLDLAHERKSFYKQRALNPAGMDKGFLKKLGYNKTQIEILQSGKPIAGLEKSFAKTKAALMKDFRLKMAEFDITGRLHSLNALSGSTRVATFGNFSEHPGAYYLGQVGNKDVFIEEAQQRGYMKEVWGTTQEYRVAGTGGLVTPEQMQKLRVTSSPEDIEWFNKVGTKDRYRKWLEKKIEEEHGLSRKEAGGWIDPGRRQYVNAHKYSSGKPGRRKGILERELTSDDDFFEEFTNAQVFQEDIAGDIKNRPAWEDVSGEDLTTAEFNEAELSGLKIESEEGREKLKEAVDKILGPEPEYSGGGQEVAQNIVGGGGEIEVERLVSPKGVSRAVDTSQNAVFYLQHAQDSRYHTNYLKRLKKLFADSFILEDVYPRGRGGRKQPKIRVVMKYEKKFAKKFDAAIKRLRSYELDLSGKSMKEIEEAIGLLPGTKELAVLREGAWKTIEGKDSKKLENMQLQNLARTASTRYGDLKNPIPVLAQAEKTFDVYFRKNKGRSGAAAYTLAGTYLGETSKGSPSYEGVGWKGKAKIFEYKGKYKVGWSYDDIFNRNRFGSLEQAQAEHRAQAAAQILDPAKKAAMDPIAPEISSAEQLSESQQLKYNRESQDVLKRVYEQTDKDYGLISPYRFNREKQIWEDVMSGGEVPLQVAEMYQGSAELKYSRRARAAEKLRFKRLGKAAEKARAAESIGRAAGAGLGGKASEAAFGGKTSKGKGLVFAALSISAALVALTAFSSRRRIMSPKDIPREAYGSNTDDERMFNGRPPQQNRANITPEYSGPMGYRTNIDVEATDSMGIDHKNFSEVMHRHASNTLRTSRGSVNTEINDHSDRSTDQQLKRKYSNMLRA